MVPGGFDVQTGDQWKGRSKLLDERSLTEVNRRFTKTLLDSQKDGVSEVSMLREKQTEQK